MRYRILYACVSHPGKVRQINQDNFICGGTYMPLEGSEIDFPLCGSCTSADNVLFGVFDGLGGEQCGETAAFLAAQEASAWNLQGDGEDALMALCQKANQSICEFSVQQGIRSAGTTAAMLLFGQKIYLCNIGDSKIFRFRQGQLEQLSLDHICPVPFGVKPPLSQSLGIPVEKAIIEPYTLKKNYAAGDVYLICSDGLTDMVKQEDIQAILASAPVETAVQQLLDQALEKGGIDNTTILLCRIEKESRSLLQRILRKREE